MSRRDFEMIAACLACERADSYRARTDAIGETMRATLDSLAERLALECEMTNPRFDRERFLRACEASISD